MSYDITRVNAAIIDLREQTQNNLHGLERSVGAVYQALMSLHPGGLEDSQPNLYAVDSARVQLHQLITEAMDKTYRAVQAIEGLRQ